MTDQRISIEPSEDTPRDRPSVARAYLQLLRVPNLFTAMADVAMGLLFVRADVQPADGLLLAVLVAASTSLYAAGVVFNDVFDLPQDARDRPQRPLPSGRIAASTARRLGFGLLLSGVLAGGLAAFLAGRFETVVVAALLAGCIVLYDAAAKRTPVGPLVMGSCRMLNVLLGMSVAAEAWGVAHWLIAGGIGTYIAGVTWFARTEARRSNRLPLAMALVVILAGIALLAWFPRWIEVPLLARQADRWPLLMTVLGLLIGWRCFAAILDPAPPRVRAAVKQGIFSLVILDAAVCYTVQGTFGAVAILLLLAPAMVLGRWIEST